MTIPRLSANRKKVLEELDEGNRLITSGPRPYFENFSLSQPTVTWITFSQFYDAGLIEPTRRDLDRYAHFQRFRITEKGRALL